LTDGKYEATIILPDGSKHVIRLPYQIDFDISNLQRDITKLNTEMVGLKGVDLEVLKKAMGDQGNALTDLSKNTQLSFKGVETALDDIGNSIPGVNVQRKVLPAGTTFIPFVSSNGQRIILKNPQIVADIIGGADTPVYGIDNLTTTLKDAFFLSPTVHGGTTDKPTYTDVNTIQTVNVSSINTTMPEFLPTPTEWPTTMGALVTGMQEMTPQSLLDNISFDALNFEWNPNQFEVIFHGMGVDVKNFMNINIRSNAVYWIKDAFDKVWKGENVIPNMYDSIIRNPLENSIIFTMDTVLEKLEDTLLTMLWSIGIELDKIVATLQTKIDEFSSAVSKGTAMGIHGKYDDKIFKPLITALNNLSASYANIPLNFTDFSTIQNIDIPKAIDEATQWIANSFNIQVENRVTEMVHKFNNGIEDNVELLRKNVDSHFAGFGSEVSNQFTSAADYLGASLNQNVLPEINDNINKTYSEAINSINKKLGLEPGKGLKRVEVINITEAGFSVKLTQPATIGYVAVGEPSG